MRTPIPPLALGLPVSSQDPARAFDQNASPENDASDATTGSALIALVLQDPQRGAAELFRQFSSTVNQLVLHITGGDAEHDDIVQSVFCTLMDTIQHVREPDKLAAWVRAIAVNAALQQLRKQRFRRLFLARLPEVTASRSFVQEVEARDLLRRAHRVLERLPPRERVVFILFHVEAQTLGSIAETLGYSVPTAKRRLARANRRFQQLIEHEPELRELVRERSRGARRK
jgi:RNA polymerase sigma factor (sigma-70 family)